MTPSPSAREHQPKSATHKVQPRLEVISDKPRISLLLPLDPTKIMDGETAERLAAIDFNPKAEFHVTALDIKDGSDIGTRFGQLTTSQQDVIMGVLANAQSQTWEVTTLDRFHALEKSYDGEASPRKSIIQMVECSELSSLYDQLNQLTGDDFQFDSPPFHVTLATQGSSRGIGLSTAQELTEIGTPFAKMGV